MVRSIVIPHDPARSPRLRHLATASEFQDAVDGWLEPIEMPALGVTVYVNEAARREHHPINCRAMAIWWLYTADPTEYPIFLGDVVLTGTSGDEETGDLPERIVQDIFEQREFVVQVQPYGAGPWRDTFARFANVFDAGTWCMLLSYSLRPGALLRLRSRMPAPDSFDESFRGSDAPW
ncbi:DUF3846 domain-containing protein [Agromyces bauzanensis]|uniref:DUF3846 domain-containing protein n=1 Tax=Agromyces bauzanensis TaxID=1308924 RepID=A0A917PUY8_9MICO|nr:DUF3846 domain-containing protein [Agromyces bauzanensis]GGJ92675.1 hypothetical protein GCM10011372_33990 [Agromyces bauzanensis]